MSIAQDNRAKYLKPPTYQEIEIFRKELGVRIATFERFYGIALGTIKKIRKGKENLPAKLWHIIFEKLYPEQNRAAIPKKGQHSATGGTKRGKIKKKKPSAAIISKLSALNGS